MSFAPTSTYYAPHGDGSILGQFRHKETGVMFEFSKAPEQEQVFGPEYCHKVWLPYGAYRLAKVLKTVAHVVTDEAADGGAFLEKWQTKGYMEYTP